MCLWPDISAEDLAMKKPALSFPAFVWGVFIGLALTFLLVLIWLLGA